MLQKAMGCSSRRRLSLRIQETRSMHINAKLDPKKSGKIKAQTLKTAEKRLLCDIVFVFRKCKLKGLVCRNPRMWVFLGA